MCEGDSGAAPNLNMDLIGVLERERDQSAAAKDLAQRLRAGIQTQLTFTWGRDLRKKPSASTGSSAT